jgi:hypothetical protein
MFIALQGYGQMAALEILGSRRMPFTLNVGSKICNHKPVTRAEVSNLRPGMAAIAIVFQDTLIPVVRDTILLVSGERIVYQIVPTEPFGISEVYEALNPVAAIFRRGGSSVDPGQRHYRLRFLERIDIQEDGADTVSEVEVISDSVQENSQQTLNYRFTREQPRAPLEAKSPESPMGNPSDTADFSKPTQQGAQLRSLTEKQHRHLLKEISEIPFEEERIQRVRKALQGVSLTSKQLQDIVKEFDFERSKLDICKKYYHQITDLENASLLYQALEFNSTIEELKRWIYEQ